MISKRFFSILILLAISCLISIVVLFPYRHRIKKEIIHLLVDSKSQNKKGHCKGCSTLFTDNVRKHQQAYREGKGIQPQRNNSGLEKLLQQKKLVLLESNSLYIIQRLVHSKPYILPKARHFIIELAKRYQKKCQLQQLEYIPFTISSVTRTISSVKALRRVNPNAIERSHHLLGKTFDITYFAFGENNQQNQLFIKSLHELRLENKCFVKFEKKRMPAYHCKLSSNCSYEMLPGKLVAFIC